MNLNNMDDHEVAEDRSSYLSWNKYRAVIHSALVCPVRILWKDYRTYCRVWGFEEMSPQQFKDELEDHPTIELKEGGRGRLRTVALGVGVVNEPMDEAHTMPDVLETMK